MTTNMTDDETPVVSLTAAEATNITLGRAIVSLRAKRGISQHELARLSGINRATIARIEGSEATKVSTVAALARGLGVSMWELFKTVHPEPTQAEESDLDRLAADLAELSGRASRMVLA